MTASPHIPRKPLQAVLDEIGQVAEGVPTTKAICLLAQHYKVDMPKYGFQIDLQGHNAVQGSFRFEA